jgi:dienelactone hydrolase
LAPFALCCLAGAAHAQSVARIEIRPIETVTLKTQQVLTGDRNGEPVAIAGELRLPKAGNERFPALILLHGSGGVSSAVDRWAQELNALRVAAFILDSFSGRDITSTADDQSQLDTLAMLVDAYRALALLARHPRIDPNRIGIMGFSKGGVAAVYSSNLRFQKMYAPAGVQFAAHIGLYTPCNTVYRDDNRTTEAPIRLFHGVADDYVAIGPCRDYVARLKRAGTDAVLTEYPDAGHGYDKFRLKEPMTLARAETTRNCTWTEADNGAVVNAKTGAAFSRDDPCVERGAHVAYNAAATEATALAVREFLTATFKLDEAKLERAKLEGARLE